MTSAAMVVMNGKELAKSVQTAVLRLARHGRNKTSFDRRH
jgi:hypothetical protein